MENEEIQKILSTLIENQVALSNIIIQSLKNKKELDSLTASILMNLNQKNIGLENEIQRLYRYMIFFWSLCLFMIVLFSTIKG